jgi:RNA polymerase sigma-70 factor (ECF subfamily)
MPWVLGCGAPVLAPVGQGPVEDGGSTVSSAGTSPGCKGCKELPEPGTMSIEGYRSPGRLAGAEDGPELGSSSVPISLSRAVSISSAFELGRAAHPGIVLQPEAFANYLEGRRPATGSGGVALHAADMFLACGALGGDAQALRLLDARLRSAVPVALRRLRLEEELRNEVAQRTRERLLVPAGSRPKLAEYEGRGGLDPWLRSVLLRVALNLLEAQPRSEDGPTPLESLIAPGPDPELTLVQRADRAAFRVALAEALAELDSRTRRYLELHVLEGLTLDEIGRRSGAHKSTISRALSSARSRLVSALRKRLRCTSELEVTSLLAMLGDLDGDLPAALQSALRTSFVY